MYKCFQCNKEISDEEYVVNWTSCSDCFSWHFQQYLDGVEMGRLTEENVEKVFTYNVPNAIQVDAMNELREKQIELARLILKLVPECADRTAALRNLRECRMNSNAAIVLDGLI